MPAWEKAETFAAYCEAKKIDWPAWQAAQPQAFAEAEALFTATGPRSFDQLRKFQLMNWRLAYPALPPAQRKPPPPPLGA
jgi:hypothetical protein